MNKLSYWKKGFVKWPGRMQETQETKGTKRTKEFQTEGRS